MTRMDLGSFEDTGLVSQVIGIIEKQGINTPTEIQVCITCMLIHTSYLNLSRRKNTYSLLNFHHF